jgi:hypothetical protein
MLVNVIHKYGPSPSRVYGIFAKFTNSNFQFTLLFKSRIGNFPKTVLLVSWVKINISTILVHILLVEKNKMAGQTEFPMFCERENGKLFAFYSFSGLKTQCKNPHKLFTG